MVKKRDEVSTVEKANKPAAGFDKLAGPFEKGVGFEGDRKQIL